MLACTDNVAMLIRMYKATNVHQQLDPVQCVAFSSHLLSSSSGVILLRNKQFCPLDELNSITHKRGVPFTGCSVQQQNITAQHRSPSPCTVLKSNLIMPTNVGLPVHEYILEFSPLMITDPA